MSFPELSLSNVPSESLSNAGIERVEALLPQIRYFIQRQMPTALRTRMDEEDIVQEIFRTILRMSQTNQATRDDWERMLWQVVRRQIRKHRNRAVSRPDYACDSLGVAGCEASTKDSNNACEVGSIDELEAVFTKCNVRERRLLLLRIQGYTYKEIAEMESVDTRTIERAFRKIGELAEMHCDGK